MPHSRDWPPPGYGRLGPGIWIDNLLPGWITYTRPGMPAYLRLMKVSRTTEWAWPPGVLGRADRPAAETARDLRASLPAPNFSPGGPSA